MTGTGCCVKLGDDLKKTRSWDSTPARTEDCVERRISITCRIGIHHTYHDCRCLVGRKLVLKKVFRPLSHCGVLFFKKSARIEGVGMQELSPNNSCIDASPRIVGGTNWFLGRGHTARKDGGGLKIEVSLLEGFFNDKDICLATNMRSRLASGTSQESTDIQKKKKKKNDERDSDA
jgi:hypothetical protein